MRNVRITEGTVFLPIAVSRWVKRKISSVPSEPLWLKDTIMNTSPKLQIAALRALKIIG